VAALFDRKIVLSGTLQNATGVSLLSTSEGSKPTSKKGRGNIAVYFTNCGHHLQQMSIICENISIFKWFV
jgi:hypothetical protein